jgi:hypothetical protein
MRHLDSRVLADRYTFVEAIARKKCIVLLASSGFGYTGGNGMVYCRVAGRPTPPQQIRIVTAQKHLNINLMLGEDEYASSPVGMLDMHLSTRDLGGCSTTSRWQSEPPSAFPVRGMISDSSITSDMSSGCNWYWGMSTTHPSGVRLRPGSAYRQVNSTCFWDMW